MSAVQSITLTGGVVSQARAADPNVTPGTLFAAAHDWPDEVLSNPALSLVSLEDPALWQKILVLARRTQYARKVSRAQLDKDQEYRGVLGALEHILPFVETVFGGVGVSRSILALCRGLLTSRLPLRRQEMLKREYASQVTQVLGLVRQQREYASKMKHPVLPATEVAQIYFQKLSLLFADEPMPLAAAPEIADIFLFFPQPEGLHRWLEEVEWQTNQLRVL